jgi:hypothetical protein
MKEIHSEVKGDAEYTEVTDDKGKVVFIKKAGIPQNVFIFAYEKTALDDLADSARDFIQFQKSRLSEIPRAILALEEKLKEVKYESDEKGHLGKQGQWFYIVRDSKVQKFLPELGKVLERVYSGISESLNEQYDPNKVKDFVGYRRQTVMERILEEINMHRMTEVAKKYDFGTVVKEEVIANICFGESNLGTHIFCPIRDMTIITRVGGFYSSQREGHDIGINKDVFIQPSEEEMEKFIPRALGYDSIESMIKDLKRR